MPEPQPQHGVEPARIEAALMVRLEPGLGRTLLEPRVGERADDPHRPGLVEIGHMLHEREPAGLEVGELVSGQTRDDVVGEDLGPDTNEGQAEHVA